MNGKQTESELMLRKMVSLQERSLRLQERALRAQERIAAALETLAKRRR